LSLNLWFRLFANRIHRLQHTYINQKHQQRLRT
jgi:hypothetical protein